jgi:hypothetical protein
LLYINRLKLPGPIGGPRNIYMRIAMKVSMSRPTHAPLLFLAYIHVGKMIPNEMSSWLHEITSFKVYILSGVLYVRFSFLWAVEVC